jgi:sodium/potassium-transporting ATPase subunit alpha
MCDRATWIRHDYPDWLTPSLLIVGCVSVAVAFIPEGLPIAVASSLTITASVMKKNNILCKSLKTVETLGSVSTICSDKTGTLTKNMMAVSDFLIGTEELPAAAAAGYIHAGLKNGDPTKLAGAITQLAEVSAICNAGEFDAATNHLPVDQRKVMGDATDSAILRFAESLVPVTSTREKWKRIYKVAFNSKNKFMIQVIGLSDTEASKSGDKPQITIKGAPDILLPRCLFYMDSKGETQPLSNEHRDYIETVKNRWSAQGKRVILLARKAIPAKHFLLGIQTPEFEDKIMEESRGQLELIGIVGIVDPPRDEIPEVIRTLRGAGIKVHMVTGDFKLTAQAIAAECGIITVPQDAVEGASALSYASPSDFMPEASGTRAIAISGDELKSLDESQWSRLCAYDEIVFARTTPEQKLRIVKELQSRGEIVGMTGDGVNDAPSLKKADIGIAVGSGSDIAIEAADMVLLDSFAAIIEAVKYGRVVFDNLKKTICYLLPAGSFAEFWPVFTNVIFGLPQILSSFLMIIICCFTDCAAATAIAYEKPEADVLLRRPRNPKKDHLVDWRLILQAYGITGFLQTTLSFTMSYW